MDFCIFTKVEVNIKHLSQLLSTLLFEGLSLNMESVSLTTLAMSKTQASFNLWLSSMGITGTHCCDWFFTWVMGLHLCLHTCAANALSLSPLPGHVGFFICLLCCFFAWDKVSWRPDWPKNSQGWLQTHDLPSSTFQVLGLQVWDTKSEKPI